MLLYPLKFTPIYKPKVWGHESWTLSAYGQDHSVVENGFLAGNTLPELLETYMDELVGGAIYQMYGDAFPLLFKFIEAKDDLSVQVHPDDMAAAEVEQLGKTEVWYVTGGDADASILMGFARPTSREEVAQSLNDDSILSLLQRVPVQKGDVAFIEAGTVHALCRGTQVAEIQESSDMTYRLYDYRRPGLDGKLRPLHIEQSLEVLNYDALAQPLVPYERKDNSVASIVQDEHFCTNVLTFSKMIERDYAPLDSFVVYMCTEGEVRIEALDGEEGEAITLTAGETALIPAAVRDIRLTPNNACTLLETYIV
ncbi:MAG: class I mannose-6-phosphate isomerase [Paludibacteraceae bacterium]|nr:class I mannose-6-phosphate isomerase [Paludibacteraceae bacterium]